MFAVLTRTKRQRKFSMVSLANADFSSSLATTHRGHTLCSCLIIMNNSNVVTLKTGTIYNDNVPLNVITINSNGSFTQNLGLPIGQIGATIRNVINTVTYNACLSISVKHIHSARVTYVIRNRSNRPIISRRNHPIGKLVSQCCTKVLGYKLSTDVGSQTGRSHLPKKSTQCTTTILIRVTHVGRCNCRIGTALSSNAIRRRSVVTPVLAITGTQCVKNKLRISPCSLLSSKVLSLI